MLTFHKLEKRSARFCRPFAAAAACLNVVLGCTKSYSAQASQEPKNIFILNVEGKRNTSPIVLGLFEHFESVLGPKVGFFQPIAGEPFPGGHSKASRHVELVHNAFGLKDKPEDLFGVTRRECVNLLAEGKSNELLDTIFARFEACSHGKDIVLIEGTHSDGPINTPANRLQLNARIAANLSAPVLMALDAKRDAAAELANRCLICKNTIKAEHAQVLGLLLNQVQPPDRLERLTDELEKALESRGIKLFGALPYSEVLGSARLDETIQSLEAHLVRRHGRLDLGIDKVVLATGTLDATLHQLAGTRSERTLVVCDASRSDLILGLSAAHGCRVGPHVAALLLTGGSDFHPHVERILEAGHSDGSHLPILLSNLSSWEASQRMANITPDVLPSSARKIEESKNLVQKHLDLAALDTSLRTKEETAVTPKKFIRNINRICTSNPKHIVLPEGTEARVLRAAAEATRKGLARITLLGEQDAVIAEANRLSVDVSKCQILDHRKSEKLERYAELLVERRKHKGMTLEKARDLLVDGNYFGTLMAASGDADGMVSGSTSTTANTIRPALQVLKTRESLVSSVFFMCLPTKVLVYGDCAVNTDPKPDELAKIGIASADTAAAFGIEPRVAFLSYSTLGSGAGPDVDKVIEAVKMAKDMRPDLMLEGPIQYDAAVDPEVARTKIKRASEVAGRASVLVVPDLNVGNIVYKAVQQSTGAIAMGPLLQGLTKPVNDLSRGCTVTDILNTISCSGVQATANH